jgi:hypothetical protein
MYAHRVNNGLITGDMDEADQRRRCRHSTIFKSPPHRNRRLLERAWE